jgi:hypothetical protein
MLQRPWLRWTLVVAGWTCAGLFFASQTYLAHKYSGGQAHVRIILQLSLADRYLWGPLAPGSQATSSNQLYRPFTPFTRPRRGGPE